MHSIPHDFTGELVLRFNKSALVATALRKKGAVVSTTDITKIDPAFRLCYVKDQCAWFTTAPLTGKGRQWGDDWNDAPYEHNAGSPYQPEGFHLLRLMYDGPLETPAARQMSERGISVDGVNSGSCAWLKSNVWEAADRQVAIPAGTDVLTFMQLVQQAGGQVYAPVTYAIKD